MIRYLLVNVKAPNFYTLTEYPLLWRKHDRNSSGTETVLFLYLILLEKNKSQNNRRGTNIYHPAAVV